LLLGRWGLWRRPAGYVVCLVLLAALGTLTWRQSRMYSNAELLYRTTLGENSACWMAHCNLGAILQSQGRIAEALEHYQQALAMKPHYAQLQNNIGVSLARCGRIEQAMGLYRKALEIKPDYGEVYNNLGAALFAQGRLDEAMADFRKAVELTPDCADAHSNLGFLLARGGRIEEAIAHYRKTLEIQPDHVNAHDNLESALRRRERIYAAIAHYQQAIEFSGGRNPAPFAALAAADAEVGRFSDALAAARQALDLARQQNNQALANALRAQIAQYQAGKPYRPAPPPSAPLRPKP